MKKDILMPPVEGVGIAITKKVEKGNAEWFVYLVNKNNDPLENAMITSKGYGEMGGEDKKTSILRHMIEVVPAKSEAVIEPIQPDLFFLDNEFWVSYYLSGDLFDKKFVIPAGDIKEEELSNIPDTELELFGKIYF